MLADLAANRERSNGLRDTDAAEVSRWRDEQKVDIYLELQMDGIESLNSRRSKLEEELRWIDSVHIRAAAREEIDRVHGPEGAEEIDVDLSDLEDSPEAA
jgi:hypothetical protein